MRRGGAVVLAVALACCASAAARADHEPYRDARLPIEKRVADLLGRMTLEEKVAQTFIAAPGGKGMFTPAGALDVDAAKRVSRDGTGFAFVPPDFPPRVRAAASNQLQRFLREQTRLGIPALVWSEGLHGAVATGATSFPQALALASSFDPELVREVFGAVALELRAGGANNVLAPVVDLARDPRWGRTEETYGEDPYLVGQLGLAAVRGFQGDVLPIDKRHVAAMLKHFLGHGQPEGGRNTAPALIGERTLRETLAVPFETIVRGTNVLSIMASYNELDGVPMHVNRRWLADVLVGEWGFRGYVSSDAGGIEDLYRVHHVAADEREAAKLALEAGVDGEMVDDDSAYDGLAALVRQGRVATSALDRAVARILRVKLLLGLFEDPYVDEASADAVTNSAAHRALARRAAEEGLVLVKNARDTLPFDAGRIRQLAVIGPNASGIHLGGYTHEPRVGTDVVTGLRAFAKQQGGRLQIAYAAGCKITRDEASFWKGDHARPADPAQDARLMAEALKVARASDAILLVLGENESTNREAWSEKHLGDRDSLELVGRQEELARAVLALGKPTTVLLLGGRPLSVGALAEKAPAMLVGWYLGQETGPAVADVLFGVVSPSGKLPITFPRNVGQLPATYDHKPSRHRSYLFTEQAQGPLFPFGHGLTYTTFAYDGLRVSPAGSNGVAEVVASVRNTGRRRGTEVVQLYVRDEVSSVTRPVKELKRFARVTLDPGAATKVAFRLTREDLAFWGLDMRRVVEPGVFDVMVGGSSATTIDAKLTLP